MAYIWLLFIHLLDPYGHLFQVRIPGPGGATLAPGAGTFTLLHTSPATLGTCSGTGTTCSVTLSSPLSANSLAYLYCLSSTTAIGAMSSVNVGGTLVPVYSATGIGDGSVGHTAVGRIYPTSATSGPVVITFSGATGGSECFIREYAVSTGTPVLEWAQATFPSATGSSATGLTPPTFTGTNDLVVQDIIMESGFSTRRNATAVSTYTNCQCDSTNGPGSADLLNTQSTSAPTWTASGALGFKGPDGVAFATNATACADVNFTDWSGSTSGTTITAALANASTFGFPQQGHSAIQANGWQMATPAAMTYVTASVPALHNSIRTCADGVTHPGSTTFAMNYDQSNTTVGYAYFGFSGGHVSTIAQYVYTTYPGSDTNFHDEGGVGSVTNNFVTLQVGGNGTTTTQLRIECNGGSGTTNFSSPITVSTSTWYWASVQNNTATGGNLQVFTDDTATTQVGSTVTCTASGWNTNAHDTFQVGQGGGTTDFPTAVFRTADVIMSGAGTQPLLPTSLR